MSTLLLSGPSRWVQDFDRMEAVAYVNGVERAAVQLSALHSKSWPTRNGKPILPILGDFRGFKPRIAP